MFGLLKMSIKIIIFPMMTGREISEKKGHAAGFEALLNMQADEIKSLWNAKNISSRRQELIFMKIIPGLLFFHIFLSANSLSKIECGHAIYTHV
jgi:hypothetical protein